MTILSGVISYPIPAYSNLPIESDFYQPSRFVISNVFLGKTTVVNTTADMDYVVGQEIRLIIPREFGCYQLNNVKGYVQDFILGNIENLILSQTDNTTTYSTNVLASLTSFLPNIEIIPNSFQIAVAYLNASQQTFYKDDGFGNLNYVLGTYTISSGTIDYTTGDVVLNFNVNPGIRNVKTTFSYTPNLASNQVGIDIDSSINVDPYVSAISNQTAQILAIGDISNGQINSNGLNLNLTYIPGSFINISPQ